MSAITSALRQILRDLVAKRLWPVALLLLVALVAIPMAIGRSGGDPVAPGGTAAHEAAATTPPANAKQPSAKAPARKRSKSTGAVTDPFFSPPNADEATTAPAPGESSAVARAAAPKPGDSSPSSSSPASAGTSAARSGTAPAPATTRRSAVTTPAAAGSSYLRTVVRINRGRAHAVARLTPLGGSADPGAVFLGVTKAGAHYAVFLLGPRASSRGAATCKAGTGCRLFGLKAGQRQLVTVRLDGGEVRRFTLRVASIRTVRTSTARARAARARVHAAGPRVVRALRRLDDSAAALRTVRYDRPAGVLRAAGSVESASR